MNLHIRLQIVQQISTVLLMMQIFGKKLKKYKENITEMLIKHQIHLDGSVHMNIVVEVLMNFLPRHLHRQKCLNLNWNYLQNMVLI